MTELSDHLFWDVDRESVQLESHGAWLMARILDYGKWSDWQRLERLMERETMIDLLPKLTGVSDKSLAFAKVRLGVSPV